MCTLPELSVSLMIGASTAGKLTNAGRAVSGEILYSQDEKLEADGGIEFVSPFPSHPSRGKKHAASFLFLGYIPCRGQRGKPGQGK